MPKPTAKKPPAAPPAPRSPLAELGIGAAWIIGLSAVGQIIAILFHNNPLAVIVVQAVVIDLAAGRAGVRWDPRANEDTSLELKNGGRGVALGAGLALAVALLTIAAGAALGWIKLAAHAPGLSILFALIRAAATGVRDALLYAGLPIYFAGRARNIPRPAIVVFSALAAGAAIAFQPAASLENVALAASVLALASSMWLASGSGWAAVGVTAGWAFFMGSVLRGAVVDIDWSKGLLGAGLSADGPPAWIAAALFTIAAAVALHRAARPRA